MGPGTAAGSRLEGRGSIFGHSLRTHYDLSPQGDSFFIFKVLLGKFSSPPLGAPHVGERSEKQLIRAFCDKVAEMSPQLVTFNGNSFDLPVLRYRAMIHGVPAPGLAARPILQPLHRGRGGPVRHSLLVCSTHTKASLNELSKIMGMPGKPEGMDGNEVKQYFLDGKIKQIAEYCETDVVNTYRVWLSYELFRGRLSESEHQASERNLAEFIAARVTRRCV